MREMPKKTSVPCTKCTLAMPPASLALLPLSPPLPSYAPVSFTQVPLVVFLSVLSAFLPGGSRGPRRRGELPGGVPGLPHDRHVPRPGPEAVLGRADRLLPRAVQVRRDCWKRERGGFGWVGLAVLWPGRVGPGRAGLVSGGVLYYTAACFLLVSWGGWCSYGLSAHGAYASTAS